MKILIWFVTLFIVLIGFFMIDFGLHEDTVVGIGVVIVLLWCTVPFIWMFLISPHIEVKQLHKKFQKNAETLIPENVGVRSEIDGNGKIYLRSSDYDRKSGDEWVITKKTIKINHNDGTESETIPTSRINRVELDEEIGYLTLYGYVTITTTSGLGGNGAFMANSESRKEIEEIAGILFDEIDMDIVKKAISKIK